MRGSAVRALLGLVLCGALLVSVTGREGTAEAKGSQRPSGCVFDHLLMRTARGVCRPHARSYPESVYGPIQRAIYDSSLIFGMPYQLLLRVASCESSLNPFALHGPYRGLFQFLPATFRSGARQMHTMTGISARTYWNPRDASYVAGFLFAVGEAPKWSCVPAF